MYYVYMHKLKIFLFTIIVLTLTTMPILGGFNASILTVKAEETLEEKLARIEAQLKKIQDERNSIQGQLDKNAYMLDGYSAQASQLYGEIQVFQKEIDELNLEIEELEVSIKLLEKQIEESGVEIKKSEVAIGDLEVETQFRIKNSYRDFRSNSNGSVDSSNIFNSESINTFFKDSKYVSIIQNDTNLLLIEIAELKDLLLLKKQQLEEKQLEIEKEKAAIEFKRTDLDKRRATLQISMNQYYAEMNKLRNENANANQALAVLTKDEIDIRTQAEAIYQQILYGFTPPGNGQYVVSGTPIGNQGCTGLCSGPHLHFSVQINGGFQDACGYLKPGGPVSGCGWGNRLNWPIKGQVYYTSAFGNRCFLWGGSNYCDFHTGSDFAGVPSNTVIYAAHDGWLYRGVDSFGANYVVICENRNNCNQGLMTGYWHLQ